MSTKKPDPRQKALDSLGAHVGLCAGEDPMEVCATVLAYCDTLALDRDAARREAKIRCGERDDALKRISDLDAEVIAWREEAYRLEGARATARAVAVGAQALNAEIEAALPPAADGEQGLAQRVRGVVARSAPRTEPGLTARDRAILAPLLDIIDADLSSTDAGRALAAVRAVVGVERG